MKQRRRARRFFVSQTLEPLAEEIVLNQEESHHLRNVIRLRQGAACLLIDPNGTERAGEVLTDGSGERVRIRLLGELLPAQTTVRNILTIAQAIPQRGKMDVIIEKASELGVWRIIPVESERTVVRIKKVDEAKVKSRWTKIIQEAKKQSGSKQATEVTDVCSFDRALELCKNCHRRFLLDPHQGLRFTDLREELELMQSMKGRLHIGLLIGPEGGFTRKEIEEAAKQGFLTLRIGDSVLRSDTAFVAAASLFLEG